MTTQNIDLSYLIVYAFARFDESYADIRKRYTDYPLWLILYFEYMKKKLPKGTII